MNVNLAGKVALVCGASDGIGAACARALAELGCAIVALARRENTLQAVVASLKPGAKHGYVVADISDHSTLEQKIRALLKERGRVDILINNTGGPAGGPIVEAKPEEFAHAMHNHVIAAQRLTQLLLPGMKENKFGRIVNIISPAVKAPIPNLGVSNATRAAMAAWAKTLAGEVAPFGVTVNNILPGYTDTARLAALMDAAATRERVPAGEVKADWIASIPMGRLGRPEEIAAAAAFLASPAASYITGINVPVDGGRTQSL